MQENKNEKVNEYERAPGFRPRLAIYHANAKGTGCAIKMCGDPNQFRRREGGRGQGRQ